jgi:hypothetical protein
VAPQSNYEVRLRFPATVEGRVQDRRTGVPLTRFTLELAGRRKQRVRDSQGRFRLERLEAGELSLRVSAPDYASVRQQLQLPQPSRPGEVVESRLVINLARAGVISGRVFDGSGRAVRGARVSAAGVQTLTGAGGRFSLGGVAEGTHDVQVTSGKRSGAARQVVVRGGQTSRVQVQLE